MDLGKFGKVDRAMQTKESQVEGKAIVWTTKKVEEAKERINQGWKLDNSPFYNGSEIDWRRGDISFQYTKEELEEIKKCKKDILYFAENYCKLMTDNGYVNIKLRDYQKDLLHTYQDNRKVVTLATRQCGKCVHGDTKVKTARNKWVIKNYNKIKEAQKKNTNIFLYFILEFILSWFIKNVKISTLYERAGGKLNIYDSWNSNKIIYTTPLEIHVLSDKGFVPTSHIHLTKKYKVYEVTTNHGTVLRCADDHIIFTCNMRQKYARNLTIGDHIYGYQGPEQVMNVKETMDYVNMYDITVATNDHRYFTNGVLSHNTTTTTIFLAWFLCFHYDKSCFFLANKNKTVKEVVDKSKKVLQYVPFYMKPGVLNKNQSAIVLDNGSRLKSDATSKNASIGDTVHLLYIDEFAHIDNNIQKEFWDNVLPTVSSSNVSRVLLTSTPNGRNLFYNIYTNAKEKNNTFVPFRIDWWQVPGRDEKWKNAQIQDLGGGEMGEEAFNWQYGCQFISSNTILLSAAQLNYLEKKKKKYEFREIDVLTESELDYKDLMWCEDFDFDEINGTNKFIISIDTAEGKEETKNGDYSIINIFKVELKDDYNKLKKSVNVNDIYDFFKLRQVGLYRVNNKNVQQFAKIIYLLCAKVFDPEDIKIVLEWNTYGSDLYGKILSVDGDENELEESYFVKYYHTNDAKIKRVGIKLRSGYKTNICSDFRFYVDAKYMELNESRTIEEAYGFGKNKKGNYEGQDGHDDIILSAINASTVITTEEYKELVEDLFDSLPKTTRYEIESILDVAIEEVDDDIYGIL